MYLKSIEIQGFKSFANKIKFEFHQGITGIVGPNGSGKSNVSDAVRWVLGEQKIKQLRGAKMEDVIFAGTENRKPLGFAFVAITLDNKDHILPIDFDEVTVSRRLFRSGESEYMINGSVVRLKDVNELFYDTGIGKDGYSIIGQGQIDKILSGKPEERRELFDEAAGIVKFKRRKSEALRKLDNENQNLVRVEDILSELEKQVGPLSKQSDTAKEYLRLRDELKMADVNYFLGNYEQMKKHLAETEKKRLIVQNDIDETKTSFENTKREYEKLEQFIEALNASVEERKSQLNECTLEKEKLDGQIRVLTEQIRSTLSNDEFVARQLDTIQKNLEANETELEKQKQKKTENEDAIKQKTEKLNKLTSEVSLLRERSDELLCKVESYKAEIIEILNEKAMVQSKMERYDTMIEQIGKRKEELSQKIIQFEQDSEEQEKTIVSLQNEAEKVRLEIANQKAHQEELFTEISKQKSLQRECQQQLEASQIQYHKQRGRLESLKNLTERYEGYGNSIKKIMELKSKKKGIIGVVADIIKVEKKYEVAIEIALGGSIQNIVTDTESTAKELIEILKKNKYGRATFLPLSSMSNRTGFANDRVFDETGVIGLACDLVTMKEEYQSIAKYLLGRTVVVDTIDHAILIAKKYHYTLRIVTLEGEQLNPGGSMSGGSFKNTSNLLGRRREIDELEKELRSITETRNKLTKQKNSTIVKMETLQDELEKLQAVLQEQYLLQNTIQMNLRQADSKKQEMEQNFRLFEKETTQIGDQMESLNQSTNNLTGELKTKEDRNAQLEKLIVDTNETASAVLNELKEKGEQAQQIQLEVTDLNAVHHHIVSNIQRMQEESRKLHAERKSLEDTTGDSEQEVAARKQAIEMLQKKMEELDGCMRSFANELQKMAEKKESQMQEHKDFFSKRETIQNRLGELDREQYRLDSTKEKLEDSIENLSNYMWAEYELTYSMAKELQTDEKMTLTDLKKQVATLKASIRALGDVNVNAIEEYKKVGERYEFMYKQHEDLVEAKKNLLKIVDELDTGMRKQFNEKFALIQQEFDKVFKELFGGGKGEIQLEEEGDVLEAGIRIISQPPGKKLQNMMQMSGGEKALTAISLLFAIQNLKPSPFCLLDEIEAALDGSNVVRFAEYLHKLTENTQFIVITHRRGTMNCADRLYGITMQEKGISTLVSVNLLESQLDK